MKFRYRVYSPVAGFHIRAMQNLNQSYGTKAFNLVEKHSLKVNDSRDWLYRVRLIVTIDMEAYLSVNNNSYSGSLFQDENRTF